MNEGRKSDGPIVPQKLTNKGRARSRPAEWVEGRGLAKGNSDRQTGFWTQGQVDPHSALDRIRHAARKDRKCRFTNLWHHVCNVNRLRQSYRALKRDAAAGMDGETWHSYGQNLEANLRDLSQRLQRGSYRAKPVQRVYIPKPDGRERPLGIPVLEDKLVQRATAEVLSAVYETDFKGFSYGFRPKRSQHMALDALTVGIERRKVSWVLDADIQGFFDTMDHGWIIRFVEHRIADRRVIRHIKKWLCAGVLEDGKRQLMEVGTPQGGSISPLLANIYLHYSLDLWVEQWRRKQMCGAVIIVRYADDFVVGFEREADGRRFREELEARLAKFQLTLHSDKTRLIEFGRYARTNRLRRGDRKPETFTFLGFTHICARTRRGRFCIRRKTITKRLRAKLSILKLELRRRLHAPIPETGHWLRAVLRGHYQYYGVPGNYRSLQAFYRSLTKMWFHMLKRRSHKHRLTWKRMNRLVECWLPPPRIVHPYPSQRLRV